MTISPALQKRAQHVWTWMSPVCGALVFLPFLVAGLRWLWQAAGDLILFLGFLLVVVALLEAALWACKRAVTQPTEGNLALGALGGVAIACILGFFWVCGGELFVVSFFIGCGLRGVSAVARWGQQVQRALQGPARTLVALLLLATALAATPARAQVQCEDERGQFFIMPLAEYRNYDDQPGRVCFEPGTYQRLHRAPAPVEPRTPTTAPRLE